MDLNYGAIMFFVFLSDCDVLTAAFFSVCAINLWLHISGFKRDKKKNR